MGIQVGALGNHNFDRGVAPAADDQPRGRPDERGLPAQPFRYVAANLGTSTGTSPASTRCTYFNVGGAKVAVIGITNEEAPALVLPGSFGDDRGHRRHRRPRTSTPSRPEGRRDAVIVITHKGVRASTRGGRSVS